MAIRQIVDESISANPNYPYSSEIDSYVPDDRLQNALKGISQLIFTSPHSIPAHVQCAAVEFQVSPESYKSSISSFKFTNAKGAFVAVDIDCDLVEQLDNKFTLLYHLVCETLKTKGLIENGCADTPYWNFGRFSKNNYFESYSKLEFKFSSDLMWYQQIREDDIEYEKIDDYVDDHINQWDGFPYNFVKTWVH